MRFGERIRSLRIEHGLTQDKLGKKLNLSKSNISKYESDKVEPSLEIVKGLAILFGVSIDYLLGVSDDKNGLTGINNNIKSEKIDISGLSSENIQNIKEYIGLIKSKYSNIKPSDKKTTE